MPGNSRYQPKDARTVETCFDDDHHLFDGSSSLLGGGSSISFGSERRLISSTQALVEFLNTTSPEEFHRKDIAKGGGSSSGGGGGAASAFFKRRKNKPNSSSASSTLSSSTTSSAGGSGGNAKSIASSISTLFSSASTDGTMQTSNTLQQRKQHTEITTKYLHGHGSSQQQQQQPTTTTTSSSDSGKSTSRPVPVRNASLRSAAGASVAHSFTEPAKSPILPTPSRHRESSLYSGGSLRQSNSIRFMSSIGARSSRTRDSENRPILLSLFDRDGYVKAPRTATVTTATGTHEADAALDTALLERMKKYIDNPSESDGKHDNDDDDKESDQVQCVRHAQTQTSESISNVTKVVEDGVDQHNACDHRTNVSQQQQQHQDQTAYIEYLKKQIAREKVKKDRLRMAYDNSCDQFEVLSGLAYKKLRVLWEEKLRWESAWIELNSQFEEAANSNIDGSSKTIVCE